VTDWQLTIDCHDPGRLVEFWAEVLGYEVPDPPDGHPTWNAWYLAVGVPAEDLDLSGDGADRLVDPSGRRPSLWFQPVPETKQVKNRLHVDVMVGGGRAVPMGERRGRVDDRSQELVHLGARIVRVIDSLEGHYAIVMADPEGNEFCLV
jgi:hypothetical protein